MRHRIYHTWLFVFLLIPSVIYADTGTLKIITETSNDYGYSEAKIYINGLRKGRTPGQSKKIKNSKKEAPGFTITLEQGKYQVEARKPVSGIYGTSEHYALKTNVLVTPGTQQTITLKLKTRITQITRNRLREKYKDNIVEPEMVTIPEGSFRMGCLNDLKQCPREQKPAHHVKIKSFLMAKHEITIEQWYICVAFNGCRDLGNLPRYTNIPVNWVSWDDTQQYIKWLNKQTGKHYRLPSESEWEYATRAGSTSKYNWGNEIGENKANCGNCRPQNRTIKYFCINSFSNIPCYTEQWYRQKKVFPVTSFTANAFGLFDMHGNISEWTQDCWNHNFQAAPKDSSAWLSGDCSRRIYKGGNWRWDASHMRSSYRHAYSKNNSFIDVGFRVAMDSH